MNMKTFKVSLFLGGIFHRSILIKTTDAFSARSMAKAIFRMSGDNCRWQVEALEAEPVDMAA